MSGPDFDLHSDGRIEGYGAYFGNRDSHGDVIEKNAFQDTLAQAKRTGRMPEMLLLHANGPLLEDSLPIGAWDEMHEDANGLYVKGRLALGNSRADDTFALLKMRPPILNGLSIGYRATKFQIHPAGQKSDGRRRTLFGVDLKEVSVVNHPSNDLARIRTKSANVDPVTRALARLAATFH
jgi:HK97 family phage prohead protease